MKKRKETLQNSTARERVYTFLKKKILELHIKPGGIINLSELEESLQLSRSPIRDALIQLENEGLVKTVSKKGTVVTKIDASRVDDERFLRSCVEGRVTIEFLDYCTESHIQELYSIIEQQKAAADNMDSRKFLLLDDAFHSIFYKATNHYYCLEAVQNLSCNYSRLRLLSLSEPNIISQTLTEHEEILDLIKKKDEHSLNKLVVRHITEKDDEVSTLISKYPDLFIGLNIPYEENSNIFEEDFLKSNAR